MNLVLSIGISFLFFIIGYVIGSIMFSIILTKKKGDIRGLGSKNAGATNVARVFGKKIGLIVFVIDVIKPIVAIVIAFIIHKYWKDANGALVQVAGLGAVVGQIFPLFFQLRGGKGAATLLGFIIAMNWILLFIGIIVFFVIVFIWKKVSLASIVSPLILLLFQIGFMFVSSLNDNWSNPLMQNPYLWVNTIVFALIWIIVVIRHKQNISRMIKGEERTIKDL